MDSGLRIQADVEKGEENLGCNRLGYEEGRVDAWWGSEEELSWVRFGWYVSVGYFLVFGSFVLPGSF